MLRAYAHRPDVIVLSLPRGGVPVAYEVARALAAPLDVFLVRKLGVPGHEELAMGAIASGGVRVVNREVVDALGIPREAIEEVSAEELRELRRREREDRDDRAPPGRQRGRAVTLRPSTLFPRRYTMNATNQNPISDLMYDWLTVLQSKAEGLNAYEKYIRDAEKENAPECVQLLRRLYEQDAQ